MKLRHLFAKALLLNSLLTGAVFAATDDAWLAEAKKTYPLTTCVVSGEPVENNDMGGPFDYVHKEEGKPDRLVRFCCESCVKRFKRDPQKHLAKIDAAAKGETSPATKNETHSHDHS